MGIHSRIIPTKRNWAMNSSRNTLAVLASIVLLLAIASASPQSPPPSGSRPGLVGPPSYYGSCSDGPRYWCANYDNMYRCGAYDYCTRQDPYRRYDRYDECRYGASYICSNERVRKLCNYSWLECIVRVATGTGSTGPGSTGPGSTAPGSTAPGSSGPGSSGPGSSGPGSPAPGSTSSRSSPPSASRRG